MFLARRELLLGSLAFPALCKEKKAAPPPPNIVLIVTEDMPAFLLGCYGNTEVQTPNIDLLAKGGVRFANHLAFSPVADPSRATLYTGRLPRQHQHPPAADIGDDPLQRALSPIDRAVAQPPHVMRRHDQPPVCRRRLIQPVSF